MTSPKYEIIQQYPLTEDPIAVHEFLGYALLVCKELDMDKHHGEHLAVQALLLLSEVEREEAEDAYFNSSDLARKQGLGLKEMMNWNKAKARLCKPVDEVDLLRIAEDRSLDTETLTEQEAVGYLLLASLKLSFVREQLTPLEMEFNYQLRVLEPDAALAIGLEFLGLELAEE